MDRRTFMATIAGSLLTAPIAADAQPGRPVPRIGFLIFGSDPGPGLKNGVRDAFLEGLREFGYATAVEFNHLFLYSPPYIREHWEQVVAHELDLPA